MAWQVFVIAASVLWTAANIIDKHVLHDELKDPILATVVSGISAFVVFGLASLVMNGIALPAQAVLLSLLAGVSYSAGTLVYFTGMRREEVSQLIPLLSTIPLFVLVLAAVFLGERVTATQFAGIVAIVLGAMLISMKNIRHHLRVGSALFFGAGAAFFLGVRNVLTKLAVGHGALWAVFFWFGLGSGLVALALFMAHHPHVRRKARKGIRHLVLTAVLATLGFLLFTSALAEGDVALATALAEIKPLFIVLGVWVLGRVRPGFLHEKMTPGTLVQRLAAAGLIVMGAIFVT